MSIIRFHTATDLSPNDYPVTAATTLEDSTEIDIRDFAGGGVQVGTLWDQSVLFYYVAASPGGTYGLLYDRDDAIVQQNIGQDRCYPLPDEIYGFGALKIACNGSINLSLIISLKG
jgi:hypothetical protein